MTTKRVNMYHVLSVYNISENKVQKDNGTSNVKG